MEIEPLPSASISKIIGLLEIIDDAGGKESLNRISRDETIELGEIIAVAKGAAMLNLLEVKRGRAQITETGKKFLVSPIPERKKMIKERLKEIPVLRLILDAVKRASEKAVEKEFLIEYFVILFPDRDPEEIFTTAVDWARYAELFGYNAEREELYLDQEF